MARMRTVKPGFFTSEDVAELSLRARLTWIGLWCYCDDEGRGKANLKLIKAAVWMLDDVTLADVQEDLLELERCGRIVLYRADGMRLLQVTNWDAHQHPNKPQKSKFPPPARTTAGRPSAGPVADREPWPDEYLPPPDDDEPPMRDDDVRPPATNATPLRADERSPHVARTLGGEGNRRGIVGEGNARETRNSPPPPHCPNHPNGTTDPCGPCGTAKRARTDWDTEQTRIRTEAAATRRAARDNCQQCDGTGWIVTPDDTSIKCTHQPQPAGATT